MNDPGSKSPPVPESPTLSPIEHFAEQKKRELEEFKRINCVKDSDYMGDKEALHACSIICLDLQGVDPSLLKMRSIFSSPERAETITHLPCFLYPGPDGMMTIPLVPVQMTSTADPEADRKAMNTTGSDYIYRAKPWEDGGGLASYFSAAAVSNRFGVSGSELSGFALTFEEANALSHGGIDLLHSMVSNVPGRFVPGANRSVFHNVNTELSLWLDNTGATEDFAMISSKRGGVGNNASVFGHPMYGRLDLSEPLREKVEIILKQ